LAQLIHRRLISAAVNATSVPSYPGAAAWPPSFGNSSSVTASAGLTAVIDTAAQTLTVSNSAPLSSMGEVIVNAGPSAAGPTDADFDLQLLQVYPNLVTNGKFDSGLTNWTSATYADGTGTVVPSVVSTYNGHTNVYKADLAIRQKVKTTQIFAVSAGHWYTARAKVATDSVPANSKVKTYLYLYNDPLGGIKFSAHDVGASGQMDGPNVWNPMEISFYAAGTDVGVQFVSICPNGATVPCAVYWDDIEVFEAPPAVDDPELTYGLTKVAVNNGSFAADTGGWWPQVYADGSGIGTISWTSLMLGHNGCYSIVQTPGQKAKITEYGVAPASSYPLAEQLQGGKSVKLSAYLLSNAATQANTGKYYAYIYSFDSTFATIRKSFAAIIQQGGMVNSTWSQIQVGGVMFSDFGGIQIVAIDPAAATGQTQFIDDVTVNMDKDPIYFWDASLFPM